MLNYIEIYRYIDKKLCDNNLDNSKMSNSLYDVIQEAFNQRALNNEQDNEQDDEQDDENSTCSTKKHVLDLTQIKEGEFIALL